MIIGIIPARFGSTRLKGKLLADLGGKSVLERTYRRALSASTPDSIVVAAGDETIASAARGFGAQVVEVFDDVPSGSDRVYRAARKLGAAAADDIVLNIQGDEPFLDPLHIDAVVERLRADPTAGVATPATPLRSEEEFREPSSVKVVTDAAGCALYFSRAPIPSGWRVGDSDGYRHIGLYGFRWEALDLFVNRMQSGVEKTERLEQLRLLHYGVNIAVVIVESGGVGIDTEADLQRAREIISKTHD